MNAKWLHLVSWVLIIVGALNWGLIGLGGFMGSDWNVVYMVLGAWPQVEWLAYVLVGAAGVYEVMTHKRNCRMCGQ